MNGAVVARIVFWALAGLALGAGFFSLLRLNVNLYGSRHWPAGIGLHVGRWALLVTTLVLAARTGALPLLSAALGILVARALVLRGAPKAQP